jgi:hypothetical protein
MKYLTFFIQKIANNKKFFSHYFIALISGFLWIILINIKSDASQPTAAYVDKIPNPPGNFGVKKILGLNKGESATPGWKILGSSALFVQGGFLAHLGFLEKGRFDRLIQAGLDKDKRDAWFYYPCVTENGTFAIGWKRRSATGKFKDQECTLNRSWKTQHYSLRNTYIAQSVTRHLDFPIIQKTAQGSDILKTLLCPYFPSLPFCSSPNSSDASITVYPARDENTLIQTQAPGDGTLRVDVLLGAVNIESDRNPQTITVEAGSRYVELGEGEGTVQGIASEVPQIINSPSLQIFLNPSNWSSNNAAVIEDLKVAQNQSSTPNLTALTFNPSTVEVGSTIQGTVTLSSSAPDGGVLVNLSSDNSEVATVPSTVSVEAGATTATFQVSAKGLSYNETKQVNITASLGNINQTATLTVYGPVLR